MSRSAQAFTIGQPYWAISPEHRARMDFSVPGPACRPFPFAGASLRDGLHAAGGRSVSEGVPGAVCDPAEEVDPGSCGRASVAGGAVGQDGYGGFGFEAWASSEGCTPELR